MTDRRRESSDVGHECRALRRSSYPPECWVRVNIIRDSGRSPSRSSLVGKVRDDPLGPVQGDGEAPKYGDVIVPLKLGETPVTLPTCPIGYTDPVSSWRSSSVKGLWTG